jgi:putative holliday junction resolvase
VTRALGLDLGSVRIGVALSDPGRVIASPYGLVERGKERADEHSMIARVVDLNSVTTVVVGLPKNMRGKETAAAQAVRAEVEELRTLLSVPVVFWDERLSTVTAQRALIEGGVRRKQRKGSVDKVAAAVILQSWLDAGCPG